MKKSLIACNVALAMDDTVVQNEIKLAKVGSWKGHRDGTFELKVEDLNQIKINFEKTSVDAVIDLDHATVFYGTGEAYGWIKTLEVRNTDLFGKVEWLEHGKELIQSGKYKYISPVLQANTIDPVTGNNIGWTLHSAAITNRPFLEDLGEVIANNKSNKGEDMKDKKTVEDLEKENEELKKQVEDAKNEKIETKVTAAIAANKIRPEQKDTLIAMGKADFENFEKFLDEAKPLVNQPQNDMFANNNNQGGEQPNNNNNSLSKEELEA